MNYTKWLKEVNELTTEYVGIDIREAPTYPFIREYTKGRDVDTAVHSFMEWVDETDGGELVEWDNMVYTVVAERDCAIEPWSGIWPTKEAAIDNIVEKMRKTMGNAFRQTGGLEQFVDNEGNIEQWVVSFNAETFHITGHKLTGAE